MISANAASELDPAQAKAATSSLTVYAESIALRARDAARLLSMSERTFRKHHAAGLVPMPLTIGRSHRWAVDELRAWVTAGCPARAEWTRSTKGAAMK